MGGSPWLGGGILRVDAPGRAVASLHDPQQPVGDLGFDALGIEFADGPFHIETCRRRLEYVIGIDVTFATSRGALQERVANPEAVY